MKIRTSLHDTGKEQCETQDSEDFEFPTLLTHLSSSLTNSLPQQVYILLLNTYTLGWNKIWNSERARNAHFEMLHEIFKNVWDKHE